MCAAKNVQDQDKAVQCDLCKLWIHIRLNVTTLNYLHRLQVYIFQTVMNPGIA